LEFEVHLNPSMDGREGENKAAKVYTSTKQALTAHLESWLVVRKAHLILAKPNACC